MRFSLRCAYLCFSYVKDEGGMLMTEKQFMSFLKKVKREIRRLGADLVPISSVKFVNRFNPVGLCLYYGGSYPTCSLEFAVILLQLDEISIHEIIAHELLHCIRDSAGHDPVFKKYAALVNEKYGLEIGTYTSRHVENDALRHRLFQYVVQCTKCGNRIGYMRKDEAVRKLIRYGEARGYCCPFCGNRKLALDEKRSVKDWRIGVRKRHQLQF